MKTVVSTGDTFALKLAIDNPISGMGMLVGYFVVLTPDGTWYSLIPHNHAGIEMPKGIKPAVRGAAIPAIHAAILSQKITDSTPRGDYWFTAAIFHAEDKITLENWRSKAIYSSETIITLR